MPWWGQALISGSAFGFLGIVASLIAGKRRASAESTEMLTGAAISLVQPYRDQVDDLSQRIDRMEAHQRRLDREIRRWRTYARQLYGFIESGSPPPPPPWPEDIDFEETIHGQG